MKKAFVGVSGEDSSIGKEVSLVLWGEVGV
jgi:hypothetical protein